MTKQEESHRSLWELTGFPGIPNWRHVPDTEEIDEVFKQHFNALHHGGAPSVEKAESALAWSVVREEDFRKKLAFNYDYEILNDSYMREPGIGEHLAYHEQVEQIKRETAAEADHLRAHGKDEGYVQRYEKYVVYKRHEEEAYLGRPELPGTEETDKPHLPELKAAGVGAAWLVVVAVLMVLAHLLGLLGPIAGFILSSPWITVPAAVLGFLGAFAASFSTLEAIPSYRNKWLESDERTFWPMWVWGLSVAAGVVVFPLWLSAIMIPVSAAVPLLSKKFRTRLFESLGGADANVLEPQELIGKDPKYCPNMFAPATSTIQAEAPALPTALPAMSRDGSLTGTIHATQERLAEVSAHCSVFQSGLASDVHKITGAILLDVVMGVTGSDDLRLVAQYGSGPMRITARAVAIGTGHEVLDSDAGDLPEKPGRSVAPWFREEAEAYRVFAEKHLCESDARLALRTAAQVLLDTRELDYPNVCIYRLETLTYAVVSASR